MQQIVSTATGLHAYQTRLAISTSLAKKTKDNLEAEGEAILRLLESARTSELWIEPHLGSNLDLKG